MKITLENKKRRWLKLWHELHAARFQPLPTEQEVDWILARLPPRLRDESLNDWLRRAETSTRRVVIPFRKFRLVPITEILLKVADDGKEPFPLLENPVETPDQVFRLAIRKMATGLQVKIMTLGSAIEDYAERYIGIAASDDPASLVLVTRLDVNGEGTGTIEDCTENRRVLCTNPKFYRIEPQDA